MTPFKAWHGSKPDLSHLYEIGCCAFILIQDQHNPKIYAKSFECILIGYSANSKAYQLYRHDGIPKDLFPGCVIEDPSAAEMNLPLGTIPRPIPLTIPIAAAPVPMAPSATATTPGTTHAHLANPLEPVVPADPEPQQSTHAKVPSMLQALSKGIEYTPASACAIAESKDAAQRLHEQHTNLQSECCIATIQNCLSIAELPFMDSDDINILEEALAVSLASPLIVPDAPDDPLTLKATLESPFSDKWTVSIQDELKSLQDMQVYKLVPPLAVPDG